jgi:putative transposase
VKGRKRHLVVDTEGLAWGVRVHEADAQDRARLAPVLQRAKQHAPALQKLWVDAGYAGDACEVHLARALDIHIEVVRRTEDRAHGHWGERAAPLKLPRRRGFALEPHRWVVERTLAWLGRYRRLSKDYEALCETSEAWIWLALSRRLLTCLTDLNRPRRPYVRPTLAA